MARKFQHSFIVCNCKQVSLGEILFAVKEKNAKTLSDLGKITDAGTSCKCCTCKKNDKGQEKKALYLDEILNKYNKRKNG